MQGQCGISIEEQPYLAQPAKISGFISNSEVIDSIRCGSYFSLIILNPKKWEDNLIWACGHNYNKELGNYNFDFTDKFVEFGYCYIKENEDLKIDEILTGNGIVAIVLSSRHISQISNTELQPKENSSLKRSSLDLKNIK